MLGCTLPGSRCEPCWRSHEVWHAQCPPMRCRSIGGRAGNASAQAADSDRDGRLTGKDAVAFFERSGLPKSELAKVWAFSDSARKGYLDQTAFYKVTT